MKVSSRFNRSPLEHNVVIGIASLLGCRGGQGLRNTLNDLDASGKLDGCEMIGDFLDAYLIHHLEAGRVRNNSVRLACGPADPEWYKADET